MAEYLNIDDLQARLKICKTSIYRLIGIGDFPAPVKFGGSVRWPVEPVEKFESERLLASKWDSYRKSLEGVNGALEKSAADLKLTEDDTKSHHLALSEHKRLSAELPVLGKRLAELKIDESKLVRISGFRQAAVTDFETHTACLISSIQTAEQQLGAIESYFAGLFGSWPDARTQSTCCVSYLPAAIANGLLAVDQARSKRAVDTARREARETQKAKQRAAMAARNTQHEG